MKKKAKPKLVVVDWMDSFSVANGNWTPLNEMTRMKKPLKIRSVGWLVGDHKHVKTLVAHTYLSGDADFQRADGDMTIPAKAIVSIREVKA